MARERPDYRATLEQLNELYPGRELLTLDEVKAITGYRSRTKPLWPESWQEVPYAERGRLRNSLRNAARTGCPGRPAVADQGSRPPGPPVYQGSAPERRQTCQKLRRRISIGASP